MIITEVLSKRDKKEFINLPKELYKNDPNWICPLDMEIEGVFDPAENSTFKNGEAKRWLLKDDNNKLIGRVAGFIDRTRSSACNQPTGGLGFFEVIEDEGAAFRLFDVVKEWLESKGIEAMDGPINFGTNEDHWGLLVEGFMPQGIGMPYNKKYYRGYFENYGFKNYFDQYSYHRDLTTVIVFPERFMKIAEWVSKKPGYSFKHLKFSDIDKFVEDMAEVFNATWASFKEDWEPIDPKTLHKMFRKIKPFLDEEIVWFAYHNDKPISFFILLPDLNQILAHLDGRLTLWNKLKFIYLKQRKTMTRIRGVVAGVVPSYQNSGIESGIFLHLFKALQKKPWYKELELSWVGDFNPKMISIYEAVGAKKAKTHVTYRYMINEDIRFSRYIEEMEQLMQEKESKKKNVK